MSLEQKLKGQREEKVLRDNSLKQKLEGEKELNNNLEAYKKQLLVKEKIDDLTKSANNLRVYKKNLELELSKFNYSFQKASFTQENYKEATLPLKESLDNYGDILKNKGIENTVDLVNDEEYANEKESLEYKKKDVDRREAFKDLAKIKASRPELDFRGGKKEGEEKSPREMSFETMKKEIEEVGNEMEEITIELEKLNSSIDEDLEKSIIEAAKPVFDETHEKNDFNDRYFLINKKPGPIMYEKYFKMADKFSEDIVKKLLVEKTAATLYEKPLDKLDSKEKESLKDNIDYLWLSSKLKETINKPNLEEQELLSYLKDRKILENLVKDCNYAFSNLPAEENFNITENYSGGIRINVNDDHYHTFSKEFKGIKEGYLKDIKIKGDEDYEIVVKDSLFTSKSKKDKARKRSDLFKKIVYEIDNGNYNNGLSKDTRNLVFELNDKQILSAEELSEFDAIASKYDELINNFKKENKNKSDYSSILGNYNNKLKDNQLKKSVINSLFKKGETVNTKEIITRTKNALEEISKEGEINGLDKKGEELKEKFEELVKMIEKNKSNMQYGYDRDVSSYYFDMYFDNPEISSSLKR